MSVDYILSWLLIGAFVTWVGIGIGYVVTKILDKIEDKKEKDFFKKWEKSYEKYTPNSVDCGDCSIRAFTKLYDVSWDEAFDIAGQIAKDNAWMPHDKALVEKIITDKFGYEMCKLEKDEKKMTVSEFAIKYNVGTYLVEISRHLVAVVDGQYYDTWDCGDKKVSKYFAKD